MGFYQDTFDGLRAEFAAAGVNPRMIILSREQSIAARSEGATTRGVTVEIVPDWDGAPTMCDDLATQDYFDRRLSFVAPVPSKHRQGGL